MAFPLSAVFDLGGKLIDRLWPDPAKAGEAKFKLMEMAQNGQLAQLASDTKLAEGQMEINKVEAANPSLWVSGWRPGMGWACVLIFVANYIGVPLLAWLSTMFDIPPPPRLDIAEVLPVLLGMLGLGAMRTSEKIKSVASV
jgi:Protein of unknown function (DUF3154).